MDLRRASLDASAHSSEGSVTIGSVFSTCMCLLANLLWPKAWVSSGSGASQGTASPIRSRDLALSNIAALVWLMGWRVLVVSARLCLLLDWASATTLSMYVWGVASVGPEEGAVALLFVLATSVLRSSLSMRRLSVSELMPFFRAQVVM
jgi:hypothetical protein